MKKAFAALLVCCLLLTSCSSKGSAGSARASGNSSVSSEAISYKTYPAAFKASGTKADVYNQMINEFTQSFGTYFKGKGELNKVTGYSKPVTVNTTNWYTSTIEDAFGEFGKMYGESMENNRWTDAIKQVYNIDVKYKWLTQDSEYTQKLRLDMTANDLPDIFIVRDQNDLAQLAASGAIWDLTDMMDKYAIQDDKDTWKSDQGAYLGMATFDGKTYGLPCALSDTDNFSYLWIRSDWMDALRLSYPTTIDELTSVMNAFVNADFDGNGKKDTTGIAIDKGLYYNTRGLFSAFNAYPENWVQKGDGTLEWGGTSETNKQALSCLADWYKKGYISSEFITQDNATAMKNVLSGKCGIVYGGHWEGHNFGDLHELDPKSNWYSIKLPTGTGKDVKSPLVPNGNGWVVVNSKFKNPEIAFKLRSLTTYGLKDKNSAWWWYEKNVTWQTSPVRANVSAFDNLLTYQNLMEAYKNNNDTTLLKAKGVPYWNNLHSDLKWEWELMFGPGEHTAMSVLEEVSKNNLLFYDAFQGPQSSTMQDRWSTIKDEQLVAFTKMIIGETSVDDGFNSWLKTFKNMSGDQITKDVNEWYKSK